MANSVVTLSRQEVFDALRQYAAKEYNIEPESVVINVTAKRIESADIKFTIKK